jgi:hypothetical protein
MTLLGAFSDATSKMVQKAGNQLQEPPRQPSDGQAFLRQLLYTLLTNYYHAIRRTGRMDGLLSRACPQKSNPGSVTRSTLNQRGMT